MYGEGNQGGGFRPRSGPGAGFAPVQVGEELDVRIEAVGEKGDGIARKRGFVLFVPNTQEGDEVRIRVTKVLRKVGFAEVIGEPKAAPPAPERKEEPAAQPIPEEPSPEDTEDFGEEPEQQEAAPAEETEGSAEGKPEEMEAPPAPEAPEAPGAGPSEETEEKKE